MQDIYISIGQNIRRRRKEKHLTQESLAANVETSAQYISRIERGQVCPSLEFLYRLSAALECPIYSLLPSTAPSASTSFFSQELASQLNSWGIMNDKSNTLLWESRALSFQVRGNLDLTEIIKISEGIKVE